MYLLNTRYKKNRRSVCQSRGSDGEDPVLSTDDVLLELSPGLFHSYSWSLERKISIIIIDIMTKQATLMLRRRRIA